MTRILSFDPAIDLTGWALLIDDGSPDGKIEDAGLIRNTDEKRLDRRASSLWLEAKALIAKDKPGIIAVELPAATGNAWGGYAGRSPLTGPVYGVAVGVVLAAAFAAVLGPGIDRPHIAPVPADEWSKGIAKGDTHKTNRVAWVQYLYNISPGVLGAKTTAGNVADAILIARHCLIHHLTTASKH